MKDRKIISRKGQKEIKRKKRYTNERERERNEAKKKRA